MKKIDLQAPASWPEEARQLYGQFALRLQQRRSHPERILRPLYHLFRHQKALGLGYRDFPAWLWKDYRAGLTPSNQASYGQALRCWLRFLWSRGHLLFPLHEELELARRRPGARTRCLSGEQIERLLALPDLSLPEGLRDRALWEMAYSTGMRLGELTRLSLSDVDIVAGTVFVRFPKNGHDRLLPLGGWALHFLLRYLLEGRPKLASPPSSPTSLWLNVRGRPMGINEPGRRLRRYYKTREQLGIPVTMHQLRHSCATHLLQHGASLSCVQALLGHRVLGSTQIYLGWTLVRLQRVHRRHHPRNQALFWSPRTLLPTWDS